MLDLGDEADRVGWDWVARRERSARVWQALQCWLLMCCCQAEAWKWDESFVEAMDSLAASLRRPSP